MRVRFLGERVQHKSQWASDVREHESVYLFLRSWRGFVVGDRLRLDLAVASLNGVSRANLSRGGDAKLPVRAYRSEIAGLPLEARNGPRRRHQRSSLRCGQ